LRQTECLSPSLHHMSVPFTIITNSYSKMFMLQQDVYVTARCLCYSKMFMCEVKTLLFNSIRGDARFPKYSTSVWHGQMYVTILY